MSFRIGVDVGGTSVKIGVVSSANVILKEANVLSSGFPDPALLFKKVAATILDLVDARKISSIGVGVAGDIDSDRGIVRISPNLGWKQMPLKKHLQKYFRCPVIVDNDANAAAWGIYKMQAPARAKNVIVMTLGTGVGGGLIVDGRLYRGATGSAGEVGHMNIDENGPLCNCGNRGCLETYVGGPHLIKRVLAACAKGQRTSLRPLFAKDPLSITPYAIAQAANKGDAYALSVWNSVGHALGLAIGDLVYILNPDMIFFTGGIAQAGPLILKPLWATLNERAFKTPVSAVKIVVAKAAAHIGIVGAALL
jgi:glucokinase